MNKAKLSILWLTSSTTSFNDQETFSLFCAISTILNQSLLSMIEKHTKGLKPQPFI